MRLQRDGYIKWILHIKDHFSKYITLYAILNKKFSTVAKYIYMFILHFGILNIIQYDNRTEFKGMIIIVIVQDGMKLINSYQRYGHFFDSLIWY